MTVFSGVYTRDPRDVKQTNKDPIKALPWTLTTAGIEGILDDFRRAEFQHIVESILELVSRLSEETLRWRAGWPTTYTPPVWNLMRKALQDAVSQLSAEHGELRLGGQPISRFTFRPAAKRYKRRLV